jgi:glycosyltransferase involved in cell wall biosynthesis
MTLPQHATEPHATGISVIIPVYNGERYLAAAVESVIRQSHAPLEILIIDDGSTDGTGQLVHGFAGPIRYVYQENQGPAAARNLGVTLARGELIAFLDADDLWLPEKLERQAALLFTNPAIDMVFGQVEQFSSPDLPEDFSYIAHQSQDGLHIGAMLIRRTAFAQVGPFATHYQAGEFIDWYARAMSVGLTQQMLAEVVMRRRLHGNNMMIRQKSATASYTQILKAALRRRRTSQGV